MTCRVLQNSRHRLTEPTWRRVALQDPCGRRPAGCRQRLGIWCRACAHGQASQASPARGNAHRLEGREACGSELPHVSWVGPDMQASLA